ncbi:hypothetical protein R1flu_001195 [Riccia fluitans]|uniref:Uncharacterized protein n=1 Tax=Riccia fluitans TaxID=41844 RepID=A0ABD1Y313_9MARC
MSQQVDLQYQRHPPKEESRTSFARRISADYDALLLLLVGLFQLVLLIVSEFLESEEYADHDEMEEMDTDNEDNRALELEQTIVAVMYGKQLLQYERTLWSWEDYCF